MKNIPAGNLFYNKKIAAIIIFIVAFSVYIPSFTFPFINDEIAFLERNSASSVSEYIGLLDKKDYDGAYYRPIPNLVSGLINGIAPFNLFVIRAFNASINALNVVMLFFVALLLFDNSIKKAIFISLLFAFFPVNFIAVIWITDLFDRLLLLFFLISVYFLLKKKGANIFSLLFFLLALLCKEMAFSFPVIVVLISYYINKNKNRLKGPLLNSIPFFLLLSVFLLFRIFILNNNLFTADDAHSGVSVFAAIKNVVLFTGILFVPVFLKEIQQILITNKYLIPLTIAFASVLLFFIRSRISKRTIVLFLIVLVAIVPASRLLMRWYLYLPSAFFALFIASFIFDCIKNERLSYAILSGLILFYLGGLLINQLTWKNVSIKTDKALMSFILEHKNEIINANEIVFLTIPAKVNDFPIYQLGFDTHFKHFSGTKGSIQVYSKSFFTDLSAKVSNIKTDSTIVISHSSGNYFLLYDEQKSSKLGNKIFVTNNDSMLSIDNYNKPGRLVFSFTDGSFLKL